VNLRPAIVAFLAFAIVTGILAVLTEDRPALVQPLALLAIVFASGGGALALIPRVRWQRALPPPAEVDSLILLRDAFHSGELGRYRILTTLRLLERELLGASALSASPDDERALARMPPDEFRRWLDRRLATLEASS
jgi:hypothetical protein